jgi:pSer/pThr/pTyr-binding forkhead associated (FHA) protein
MKLLFPNGEHAPIEIKDGVTKVGSGAASDVLIAAPGIAQSHCEIECLDGNAKIKVADSAHVVVVNGRQASGEVPIKPGDLVLFAKVGARVVAGDAAAPAPKPAAAAPATQPNEDDGRTKIRMALPRFVLRGVSGSTFGKTYPLFGTMTVGRAADCDISIPGEEISRKHAKLQVQVDGIAIEDLGSSNGTFINGKRVQSGVAKGGDEIRLDPVRFMLVAPGQEMGGAKAPAAATPAAAAPKPAAAAGGGAMKSIAWVVVGLVVTGAIIGALVYFDVIKF